MNNDEAKREHDANMSLLQALIGSGFLPKEQQLEGKILLAVDMLHSRVDALCDIIKMHRGDDEIIELKEEVLTYIELVTGGIDMFISQHPEYAAFAKPTAPRGRYKVWCETKSELIAVLEKAEKLGYKWLHSSMSPTDMLRNQFFRAPDGIFFKDGELMHGFKQDYERCDFDALTVAEFIEKEF